MPRALLMKIGANPTKAEPKVGFTLVELLLAVALLLLLLGAVVFNYSALQRGARLDEGAGQMETLFRFARAQAASSGRAVRIEFVQASTDTSREGPLGIHRTVDSNPPPQMTGATSNAAAIGGLIVGWESDPFGAPGRFVPLSEAQSYLEQLDGEIRIVRVSRPGARTTPSASEPQPVNWTGYSAVQDESNTTNRSSATGGSFVPGTGRLTFYPDGTSDSINVWIGSLDDDDSRQLLISLSGITGAIQRRFWDPEEPDNTDEPVTDTSGDGSRDREAPYPPAQSVRLP